MSMDSYGQTDIYSDTSGCNVIQPSVLMAYIKFRLLRNMQTFPNSHAEKNFSHFNGKDRECIKVS